MLDRESRPALDFPATSTDHDGLSGPRPTRRGVRAPAFERLAVWRGVAATILLRGRRPEESDFPRAASCSRLAESGSPEANEEGAETFGAIAESVFHTVEGRHP
jgi:hypothetical protein